jgi:hypothetical protein
MQQFDPRGVPLVPDARFVSGKVLTSVARACLYRARAIREVPGRNHFSDDRDVELVLRAAVSPTSTTNTGDLTRIAWAFVAALAPASAAARVIDKSVKLAFNGALTVGVPGLTLPNSAWVGETHAIPVIMGSTTTSAVLEPYKLAAIVTLTSEMMANPNAEALMRQVLTDNVGPVLDAALFGSGAGTVGIQPAGLLNGVAPLGASTAGSLLDAMISDIGSIGAALGSVAGSSAPIIVAAPGQAVSLKLFAPSREIEVYASNALAPGTVVGVVPAAVASIVEAPRIDASADVEVQAQDNPGSDLLSTGPVYSMFQKDSVALKLTLPATWARRSPSAAAWIAGAKW